MPATPPDPAAPAAPAVPAAPAAPRVAGLPLDVLRPHPDAHHLVWMLALGLAPVAEPAARQISLARDLLDRAHEGGTHLGGLALTLLTAGFAAALGAIVARTQGLGARLAALVGGAMLLGCADTVAAAMAAQLAGSGDLGATLGTGLLAGLFSPVYGAPIGLACGLAALVPTVALAERRSALHADVSLAVAGVWAATFWPLALAVLPTRGEPSGATWFAGALASLAGAAAVAEAGRRALVRAHFLERVKRDLEPGFRLRVVADDDDAAEAASRGTDSSTVPSLDGGEGVVLEALEAADDPYRSVARARPIAKLAGRALPGARP